MEAAILIVLYAAIFIGDFMPIVKSKKIKESIIYGFLFVVSFGFLLWYSIHKNHMGLYSIVKKMIMGHLSK